MSKKEFFIMLRQVLKKLPQDEIDNAVSYYDEMISDKIDVGMSESEAVESLGDIYKLRAYITAGSIENHMKQKLPKSPIKSFFTVLALCSSPLLVIIGGSLLITLFAVLISFAAAALSLFVSGLASIAVGIASIFYLASSIGVAAGIMSFFAYLFAASVLALLGVLLLKALIITVKGIVKLFAKVVRRKSKHDDKAKPLAEGA